MRRKDRQMDETFGYQVIDDSSYGVVSCCNGELPVSIPLSLVRKGNVLYFHSAPMGEKVDVFSREPKVKVVFVSHAQVPQLFTKEEIAAEVEKKNFRFLGLNVYTTEFSSAIVEGRISQVQEEEEMRQALYLLCQKYTPDFMEWVQTATEHSLHRLHIYRIDMDKLTAKRKAFDEQRKECKGNYQER